MKESINDALDRFFEKPLLAIPVAIVVFYLLLLLGKLAPTNVSEYAIRIVIGAILTALIFWLRGDRMRSCGFGKRGLKNVVLILPIIVIAALVLIGTAVAKKDLPVEAVFFTAIMAVEAGFCEEIMVRWVPLGNTLGGQKSMKAVIGLLVYTSIIFGALHIFNALRTGSLSQSGMQVVTAIFGGLYFGAVYLRSGSIIPSIIAHTLWDFMLILNTGNYGNGDLTVYENVANQATQSGGLMSAATTVGPLAVAVFWLVLTLVLLRKSKRAEIMENFVKAR